MRVEKHSPKWEKKREGMAYVTPGVANIMEFGLLELTNCIIFRQPGSVVQDPGSLPECEHYGHPVLMFNGTKRLST